MYYNDCNLGKYSRGVTCISIEASYQLQLKLTIHVTHVDDHAFCPTSLFTTAVALGWDHVTVRQEEQFQQPTILSLYILHGHVISAK